MWWKNFIIQLKINLLGHSSSTAVVQYCNIYAEEQWISLKSSSSCTLSIWMTIGNYSKDFYAIVSDNPKRINCSEREGEREERAAMNVRWNRKWYGIYKPFADNKL